MRPLYMVMIVLCKRLYLYSVQPIIGNHSMCICQASANVFRSVIQQSSFSSCMKDHFFALTSKQRSPLRLVHRLC